MIKVLLKKDEIVISGHALYDKYGKDIVCAAVSATVLTTINAIISLDKEYIEVEEGNKLIIKIIKHDNVLDVLINNMINMLIELKEDYSKYINIVREG